MSRPWSNAVLIENPSDHCSSSVANYVAMQTLSENTVLIALLAAALGQSAYLHKKQIALKLQMGTASQCWAFYFFLLHLPTAQWVQICTGLRTWLSIYANKHPQYKIPYLVLTVIGFVYAIYATWQGWVSVLPTLAAVNSTVAYLVDDKKMRLMFLISSGLSFAFAIVIQSPLLFLLECIGVTMNIVAIKNTSNLEAK